MKPGIPVNARCPACNAPGSLFLHTFEHEVTHFGLCLETTLLCRACGWRQVDFFVADPGEPSRWTLTVNSPEDLDARVVRANSATYRIPEIGFTAEPTGQSESFVSNVEGLLDRVERVFLLARGFNLDDPEKVAVAERGLARIGDARASRAPLTIILDDPFGNSGIGSPRATRRPLSTEEIAALKTGTVVFERDAIEDMMGEG